MKVIIFTLMFFMFPPDCLPEEDLSCTIIFLKDYEDLGGNIGILKSLNMVALEECKDRCLFVDARAYGHVRNIGPDIYYYKVLFLNESYAVESDEPVFNVVYRGDSENVGRYIDQGFFLHVKKNDANTSNLISDLESLISCLSNYRCGKKLIDSYGYMHAIFSGNVALYNKLRKRLEEIDEIKIREIFYEPEGRVFVHAYLGEIYWNLFYKIDGDNISFEGFSEINEE